MVTVIVNDKMQKGYSYELTEPMGKNFSSQFKPGLTPPEMLRLGVFEGHYLNDCRNEFPESWFEKAQVSENKPDIDKNCFQIKSRLSLGEWRRRGWIVEPDPRGWFQWYCRYYMGRRIPDVDEHQIKRWRSFTRHRTQLCNNCMWGDVSCRPRQRQALLQWGYNPFI